MTIRPISGGNNNLQLSDYESFLTNVYDKEEFKKQFIKVRRPLVGGGHELEPFIPYPYQNAWSADLSPQKAANKSRQVGFSYNELADSVIDALTTPSYRKLFTSVTQPQANELLRIALDVINLMDEKFRPKLKARARNIIEFDHNGARLIALPSSAPAVRSFSGDIFMDELAHVPNDEELLEAILSVTVREGYQVNVGSTPYGQRGRFHKIFKEAGWDTTLEWHDRRLAKEFFRKYAELQLENESAWSVHLMTWWMCSDLHWARIKERAKTKDAMRQEYGLVFLDETTAVLPYQVLLDHVDTKLEQFLPIKSYAKPAGAFRVGGLDPAERGNQTAFVVFDRINNVYYKKYRRTWVNTPHTIYAPEVARLTSLWKLDKLHVDETGMGIPIMSTLKTLIPMPILNPIWFNNTMKGILIYNMMARYEAGYDDNNKGNWNDFEIITDHDVDYMDQLHQLRKEKNKQGKDIYSGKIEGKNDDIIWATALGLSDSIEFTYAQPDYERVSSDTARGNQYGNQKKH